jgi:hypothetical protein
VSGLGALAELDLDHPDLCRGGLSGKPLRVEAAVRITATEITAAQFPDQVTAVLAVIRADAALPGVVGKATELRAAIEGADRVRAHRAEAERGNIQDRRGIRLAALCPADRHAQRIGIGLGLRPHGMAHELVAIAVDVVEGAEGLFARLVLGALVDQGALRPREGQTVIVGLEQILAQLWPHALDQETDMADHRIVAQHRMPSLQQVVDAHQAERGPGQQRRHRQHGAALREREP